MALEVTENLLRVALGSGGRLAVVEGWQFVALVHGLRHLVLAHAHPNEACRESTFHIYVHV